MKKKKGQIDLKKLITVDPAQCGGRPCIRGMRIRISDVLDLMAEGLTIKEVLEEFPDLTDDDVRACFAYASRRVGHPAVEVV